MWYYSASKEDHICACTTTTTTTTTTTMRDDDFVASPKGPTFSKTENFQSTMSSLNYGHVMERAARDYQREMMMQEEEEEEKRRKTTTVSVNVLDEGGDDDEEFVRQMQKKRLEQLKNGTFEATTLMVVRWCFGGRNHRTCDDGLFYFSDGRK